MAILQIVKDGDPILRKVSRPVDEITPKIITLLDDMRDTMAKANGAGLAAVQVGVLRRVVLTTDEDGRVYEMINPEILTRAGMKEDAEGCLSVPGIWGLCRRPKKVSVRYQNREGEVIELLAKDFFAKAICHELDHLDGKLFTDCMIRTLSEDEVRKRS